MLPCPIAISGAPVMTCAWCFGCCTTRGMRSQAHRLFASLHTTRVPMIWDTRIYDSKVSGLRRQNHEGILTADGEAADTPLRIFTQNTVHLCCLGLFFFS